MSNADVLIFFINEQTLRDDNCLLTLQYAWNLMLPVLMLRPPNTKLVISNRDAHRNREKIQRIGESVIVRSASGEPWQLLNGGNTDIVDYQLLQDVLYEGYRLSILYDDQSHSKSMNRLRCKLSSFFSAANFLSPMSKGGSSSSSQPHFYLSPSNSDLCDARKFSKSSSPSSRRQHMRLNLSQSTGNLSGAAAVGRVIRTPYPVGTRGGHGKHFQFAGGDYGDDEEDDDFDEAIYDEEEDLVSIKTRSGRSGRRRHVLKSPPPPDRIPSSVGASETEADDPLPPPPTNPNMFKTPTLDLPEEEDSEFDADAFPLPPPTPITPASGLFSLPSGRNSTARSRGLRSSRNHGSITSRTSSLDRRMSLTCLEDMSNYQKTQYLVFPLRDSAKKPYLVKFPEDMAEEEEKHGASVWGSDTSLEEEIKLAEKINAGIVVDYMDDSPIASPAPYLGDLH
ncbi:unnamed protein product [Caenorhabditis sp. 36 PRJEB53466]|nr:unnamed protein product [Caenorhabditis sp. 36 PRJEB53466]